MEFTFTALKAFDTIATWLDLQAVDYDALGESITITVAPGQVVLLNIHATTHQIWLSSPRSGAHHFTQGDDLWHNTRNPGETLGQRLSLELTNTPDGGPHV